MADDIYKDIIEVEFDWTDSDTYVNDDRGELIPAGTVIKLISQIIFLTPLTEEQLNKLKTVVVDAVDHELSKRKVR